jgi:hypothetical protein
MADLERLLIGIRCSGPRRLRSAIAACAGPKWQQPRSRPTPQGDDQGCARHRTLAGVRSSRPRPGRQRPALVPVSGHQDGLPQRGDAAVVAVEFVDDQPHGGRAGASIAWTPPAERGNTRLPALSQSPRMEENRSFSINCPKSAGRLDFNWQFKIELSDTYPVDRSTGACNPPLSLAEEREDTLTLYPIGIRSDIGFCLYS